MPNIIFRFSKTLKSSLKSLFRYFAIIGVLASALMFDIGCTNQSDNSVPNFISSSRCAEVEDPSSVQGNDLLIVVLVGQSIMSGRGKLKELPESFRACRDDILLFGNDYRWRYAREPIDDGQNQVDIVSLDLNAAVSPGMAFATSYLKRAPEKRVLLVPCAKGGSLIAEWQRNPNRDSLYGSCLYRFKMALRYGVPLAVLFQQGESDALDIERLSPRKPNPRQWDKMFVRFVEDFRTDSGVTNLPVVYAQVGRNGNPRKFSSWDIVRKSQARALQKLSNVAMVHTDDLPLQDDVHLTTRGTIILGERYAERVLQLTARK